MKVEAIPRAENLGCWTKIWIDLSVSGNPYQKLVWASAPSHILTIEDAEAFVTGEINEKELKEIMKRRKPY